MEERRSNLDLRERIKELEFTSRVLQVQQELSLDGILVVDSSWKIISFNQRFVKMWEIPQHILDAKDDRTSIQSILSQLKDPDQFLDKVKHLMAYPSEKSRDELELNNGRIFERYSAPIIEKRTVMAGRIWFFRDITEIKQAEERLQQQNLCLEHNVQQRTSQLNTSNKELVKSRKACTIHQEELAQKNIGLQALLYTLEEEKKLLDEKTTSTFREALIPLFELLKESSLSEPQQHLVQTIEQILSSMSSSLTHSMKNNTLFFTPTELKVATFINAGKTSKEISVILNSSNRTIEGHRLSIRKKFELKPGQNLRVFLQSLN